MKHEEAGRRSARFAGFESIPVRITVKVGGATCTLGRLMELAPGDVITLDRRIGQPFELCCGEVLLGRVEPVAEQECAAVKLLGVAEDDDDGCR